MTRRWGLFSVCLVLLFFANFAHADTSEALVSSSALRQAGLKSLWQTNLPLEKNEKISEIYVTDQFLYVSTDQNYFYAVDRQKGHTGFIVRPAAPNQPIYGPTVYDGKLMFMVGRELLVLDPALKKITRPKRLDSISGTAVSAPVRNSANIYVASSDNKLYGIDAKEYYRKSVISAENDSMINSIIADDNYLIFATEAGNIVRLDIRKTNRRLWQRDVGGIKAPLQREGNWLYVSTTDAKVSKINMATSMDGWLMDFIAGEELKIPVTIGKQIIYQYAGKKGLYAIGKDTGKKQWLLPNGIGLMAESGSFAYIFEKPGRLTVMENKKPAKLYSVNLANVDVFATNTIDEKIFVSDFSGRLMAIGTAK